MKTRLLILALLFIFTLCRPCSAESINDDRQFIDLVESVPVETNLSLPGIPKTGDVWLEMIRNAKSTIDIEVFYFANKIGEPLESVINAIKEAGSRGVKVRIIADENFRKESETSSSLLDGMPNITWKWIGIFDKIGGIMHAKYFIVDGKDVFLGSQNFDWRSIKHISEVGVRVRHAGFGKCISDLFETDWKLCDSKKAEVPGNKSYPVPFRIEEKGKEITEFYPVYSPRGMIPENALWEEKEIVRLIDGAKREILLQLLTYSPISRERTYYPQLDNALRRAANRGVELKIVVSDWSTREPLISHIKSLAVLKNITVKISTIPRWSMGYIPYARVQHSKFLVIDGNRCWIGSSNWEKGYFYNCRNLGIIIKSWMITGKLREIFFNNWMGPYTQPIDVTKDYIPPQTAP